MPKSINGSWNNWSNPLPLSVLWHKQEKPRAKAKSHQDTVKLTMKGCLDQLINKDTTFTWQEPVNATDQRFLCWVSPLELKLMMLYLHPLNENLWTCIQALVFFSRDESDSNVECSVGRTHYAQSLQVTPIRYARFLTTRWKGHINVTTNKFCQLEKSYCH